MWIKIGHQIDEKKNKTIKICFKVNRSCGDGNLYLHRLNHLNLLQNIYE